MRHSKLATLMTLAINPPMISYRPNDCAVVRVYSLKAGRYCDANRGPLPMQTAFAFLRNRLNLHVVELHKLGVEIFGEEVPS